MHTPHTQPTLAPPLPLLENAIVDSEFSGIYLVKGAPCNNINPSATTICVGTATGKVQQSAAACTLALLQPPTAASKLHTPPTFTNFLVGFVTLYDANWTVVFIKSSVTMFDPQDKSILTGWRERNGPKL